MSSIPQAAFVGMLLFFLCPGHRTARQAQAVHVPTRCTCLKFQEKVDPRIIRDFQIIEKGAHCHRHEIILTVRLWGAQRETCLDSSKRQGKNLLHCWKRYRHLQPWGQGDLTFTGSQGGAPCDPLALDAFCFFLYFPNFAVPSQRQADPWLFHPLHIHMDTGFHCFDSALLQFTGERSTAACTSPHLGIDF
ncbi:unnamed protein product, partial [Caretta caretta]